MPNATPTGLLSPAQFDQYTAKWLAVVSDPANPTLGPSFQVAGDRLLLLRLPIDRLVSLLSTVNIQSIKVRFLLLPDATSPNFRFGLALFATNDQEGRLSAYYIVDEAVTVVPSAPTRDGGTPTVLANSWLQQWAETPEITAALFATSFGPLQGYNFELEDFLDPLLGESSLANLELQLSFGVHAYYSAAGGTTPTQTFGLLLRVVNAQQAGGQGYYDMGATCPPST